jgi:prevent-host-death family protein
VETVSNSEVRAHFRQIIDRVSKGESFRITRRGVSVATLTPVPRPRDDRDIAEVIAEIREFGKGRSLGGLTFRGIIDEGRRF